MGMAMVQTWFNALKAGQEEAKDYDAKKSVCSSDGKCYVTSYKEVTRLTGKSEKVWEGLDSITDWEELPIDPIFELIIRRPLPSTSIRAGTEYGYEVYEHEFGYQKVQELIVDMDVKSTTFIGGPEWTGQTEFRALSNDTQIFSRRRYQTCIGGSCE